MSELCSRTPLCITNHVMEMLKIFSLSELFYILEQDSTMTHLDGLRTRKITEGLRMNYGGNQTTADVEYVINSLSGVFRQDLLINKKRSIMSICSERLFQHNVLPFTSVCPICSKTLETKDAHQRAVKVYGNSGFVVAGLIFLLVFLSTASTFRHNVFFVLFPWKCC